MSGRTIEIPPGLLEQVERAAQEGGFADADDFVVWALEGKLRELSRELFYTVTDRVKDGLARTGHSPEDVLIDFERHRRSPDHS